MRMFVRLLACVKRMSENWFFASRNQFFKTLSSCLLFSLASSGAAESRIPAGNLTTAGSSFEIPTRIKACSIFDELRVASRIVAKESFEARSVFMSTIDSFQVVKGQSVKKGQLLVTTQTSSLEKMRSIYADYVSLFTGQLKTASNARTIAEARRDRIKGLADKGIVAVSELEQAENAAVIAKQVEERVKREREFMQKNIETFDLQIKQSNFYSEIDGVVTDLIVDPKSLSGNLIVMPGAMVVKVDRPGIYRAEAQLLDTQVHGIKAGMKASVTLPDGSQFSGKVVFVSLLPMVPNLAQDPYASPLPDKMAAAVIYYKAIIDFERTGAILPPGLLAEVSIVKDEYKAKACLPWNAIEVSEGKAFIRVFEDGKGWQQIPITVGRRGRYYAEVMTPIAANAIIKSKIW